MLYSQLSLVTSLTLGLILAVVFLPDSSSGPFVPPSGTLGRRERHKLATRQRLYEAAMTLFAEKGYDGTSIDDIAERADVARATIFNYFKRKDEFLDAWTDERRQSMSATATRESSGRVSAQEQLREAMRGLAAVNERDRSVNLTLVLAWVRAGRPVDEEPYTAYAFADIVAEGVAHGEIRPGTDAELVGFLLRDVYLGTLYRWVSKQGDSSFSLADGLLAALEVVLEGLAPGQTQG
jgi:TetR/AcrR family transcriptional regulator, cholesterol catabolism regulator